MFDGDIGYTVQKGPDLWRLLQALAGNRDSRPQPVFTFYESPVMECDWSFAAPCLSLLGIRRLDAEGITWSIEGYFDIRASDPGQFWHGDSGTKHLVGKYNTKTRIGLLREWDSEYAQKEERSILLNCPDNVTVPGRLEEVPLTED